MLCARFYPSSILDVPPLVGCEDRRGRRVSTMRRPLILFPGFVTLSAAGRWTR